MRKITSVILVVLAVLMLAVPCFAATSVYEYMKVVKLTVGDKNATVNYQPKVMDQGAYVNNGRTLVPFRFLGEALGAQVNWNSELKQAKLTMADAEVMVTIGSQDGLVNGKTVKLDVPAEVKDGRLFVPLRFVSENLGTAVLYDAETKSIMLRRLDMANWATFESPNGLSYKHHASWKVQPNAENEIIVDVTSPKGSVMNTFVSEDMPSALVDVYKTELAAAGWTFEKIIKDDETDAETGYEMLFSKNEGGKALLKGILVDKIENGSMVGEIVCNEADYEVDAYIMYQIMIN